MGSRLVNVRLDEARVRKAQFLRERGVPLSDVLREALDARFEALRESGATKDVRAVVARLFEDHPDPADLPPRGYSVHDRRVARQAIVRRLRSGRR